MVLLIEFDAVGSGNNDGGATTITWSHTVGSGPARFMAIGISIKSATAIVTSITVGSQSATKIRSDYADLTIRGELWYLIAPNTGTQTITVTLSETAKACGGSISYINVDQLNPIYNSAYKSGTSTTPNVDLSDTLPDSMVFINNAINQAPTVISHDSGQTHRYYQVTTGGATSTRNVGDGDDKLETTGGAKNYQITISASQLWVVQVFSFKPRGLIFGYETLGTAGYTYLKNVIRGSVFLFPETSGEWQAKSITVGIYSEVSGCQAKCAIYRHSDLALIGVTEEKTIPLQPHTWVTFNFPSPPSLELNTEYILVVWANSWSIYVDYDIGDTNQGHNDSETYDSFPNPLVPTHDNNRFSIYCTYEAIVPPPPSVGHQYSDGLVCVQVR